MTETKFCFKCGSEIDKEAEICVKCGVRQSPPARNRIQGKDKDKLVAGLLGILLGGVGIHKFYLKEPAWGIMYILFCWTFIPTAIGFIEGVVYLCMSDEKFDDRYNFEK